MATEPKSKVSSNGIRTFMVKAKDIKLRVGVGINPQGYNTLFKLARPDIKDPDSDILGGTPLWARLSARLEGRYLKSPDSRGHHLFWMRTYSENVGLLEEMIEAGIIEEVGQKVRQGFAEFPLVRLLIPMSEMMKECGGCGRWEQATDEKRMQACSRCKEDYRVYYCSAECQLENWKSGYPAHKRICGKEW